MATTARLDDVSRFAPVPLGPGKPFVAQTYKPGTVQSGVPARELADCRALAAEHEPGRL
jgi:hypothetical protein